MFVYFIPGSRQQLLSAAEARKLGFGHACDDGGALKCVATRKGPDGKAGLLAATAAFTGTLRYDASSQTWRKAPGNAYWVGLPKDAQPTPEIFQRHERFDGQLVELADGNRWLIPRLVGVLAGRPTALPRRFDLDEEGEPILSLHEKYQDVGERSFRLWLTITGQLGDKPQLTVKEELQLATDAIGLNYRLSHLEIVGLLRLLDTRSLTKVLYALIDADAIEEDAKKRGKAQGGQAPSGSAPSR